MFINNFFTAGLKKYFSNNKISSFETHVIACICDIYGEDEVKKLYINKDQTGFIELIKKYGYPENYYVRLVSLTLEYENYLINLRKNPELKTNVYNKIEAELIKMVGFKWMMDELTNQELIKFENDLINDFEIIKFKYNSSTEPEATKELWEARKKEFRNSIKLETAKIDFLSDEVYKQFNLEIDDVKDMDYRMVERLNKSIIQKMQEPPEEKPKEKKSKFVLANATGKINFVMMVCILLLIAAVGIVCIIIF